MLWVNLEVTSNAFSNVLSAEAYFSLGMIYLHVTTASKDLLASRPKESRRRGVSISL